MYWMDNTILVNADQLEAGKNDEEGGISSDFMYNNNVANADLKIRLSFMRKVYSLLGCQLFLTTSFGALFIFEENIRRFIMENIWLTYICLFGSLFVLIALHFKRKSHPTNLYLLAVFTVMQSVTIGTIVSLSDRVVVLQAFILTFFVVAALTAYTFQSKKDFSFLGLGLYSGLVAIIVAGFMQIFFQNTIFEIIISAGGAILFSFFIIYDTHRIMKTLSPEEYILATIDLYLDIINLFLFILRLLNGGRRS